MILSCHHAAYDMSNIIYNFIFRLPFFVEYIINAYIELEEEKKKKKKKKKKRQTPVSHFSFVLKHVRHVNVGFTGVYIIFLILLKDIDCGTR